MERWQMNHNSNDTDLFQQNKDQAPYSLEKENLAKDNKTQNCVSEAENMINAHKRYFFPCNREDALLLLGGLCVSEFFPDRSVHLALTTAGPALLEDGLREAEEMLLTGGNPARFPVLLEIDRNDEQAIPNTIQYGEIKRIVFRTQPEADAFRHRPVDEFNPQALPYQIEAEKFGKEGDPRFFLRTSVDEHQVLVGNIADRFIAGIHFLLLLGEKHNECQAEITRFLTKPRTQASDNDTYNLNTAWLTLEKSLHTSKHTSYQDALTAGFSTTEYPPSQGTVLRHVSEMMLKVVGNDEFDKNIITRWIDIAEKVLKNLVVLDGSLLSDNKSVLLRGALLALMTDDINALSAFLNTDNPAGVKVSSVAAFLSGLKQGVMSIPWEIKKSRASQMSFLIANAIHEMSSHSDPEREFGIKRLVNPDNTEVEDLVFNDVRLTSWPVTTTEEQVDETDLREKLSVRGLQVVGPGKVKDSWIIKTENNVQIEIIKTGLNKRIFPSLRFYLDKGQKFINLTNQKKIFQAGGKFWHPGEEKETGKKKEFFLYCDLINIPDQDEMIILTEQLIDIVDKCVVKRGTRTRSKK